MTVVDVRAPRRPTARPPRRPVGLTAVEPGLGPATTLRLTLGLVALGALLGVAQGAPQGAGIKGCFIAACLVGPILGRPSGLRAVLRSLPIAWVLALAIAEGSAISPFTVKDMVLKTGTNIVLLAPWLWSGWAAALAVTFARGGLRRR